MSHSSKDKDFVRKLTEDLKQLGHIVWFDEHEVNVGESIVAAVQSGLESADYAVLVLSTQSEQSIWVNQEWQAKYWQSIERNRILVLPILIETCEIPLLLRAKKYADFRSNYAVGLVQLTKAITSFSDNSDPMMTVSDLSRSPEASGLLTKIQSCRSPIAECIAQALSIAIQNRDKEFEHFCRSELGGWVVDDEAEPESQSIGHRQIKVLVSPFVEINPEYIGWDGDLSNAMAEMERDTKRFFPRNLVIPWPVSRLEASAVQQAPKGLQRFQLRKGSLLKDCANPDALVVAYARSDCYSHIIEGIRQQVTARLLRQFPSSVLK